MATHPYSTFFVGDLECRLLLDYNDQNGRARNVTCENETPFACWGAVRDPDTLVWHERTFPPNSVTNQPLPPGQIEVVVLTDEETGSNFVAARKDDGSIVNLETQFKFPVIVPT